MDVEQPLEQLENTNNLLLKYDLDKEQFHFQQQQRGKPIVVKKNANAPVDDITFDDKGIMIIEEHKRVREAHDEEHQQQAQKQIEQPLNFKKKTKGKFLFIQLKFIRLRNQERHIKLFEQEVM